MSDSVAQLADTLRDAGFNIRRYVDSPLWHVEGRGPMNTGQLIDLASKVKLNRRGTDHDPL
jgi:hypothetical protein